MAKPKYSQQGTNYPIDPSMVDPRPYLDSGDTDCVDDWVYSKNADASGAKLLMDPGMTDMEHSNKGYSVETDCEDVSPSDSEVTSDILSDSDEYPHSEKFEYKNPGSAGPVKGWGSERKGNSQSGRKGSSGSY